MKTSLWKLRFAARFWWRTRVPWRVAWQIAAANLETIADDTTVPPAELVDEEIKESMRG